MEHTLNSISAQILNDVYAGLKAPGNFSVPQRQIKDEFGQARNRYMQEEYQAGRLEKEAYMQTIPKLAVVKKDFVGLGLTTSRKEYWAEIPEALSFKGFNAFEYITTMDKAVITKIVYGDDFRWVQFDKYTAKMPTIWIQDKNLWLLNPPVANIQWITLRYILDNPRSLNGVAGIKFMDDDPYPAPGHAVDAIKNKMVNDYLRHYRLANPLPTLVAGDLNMGGGETKK